MSNQSQRLEKFYDETWGFYRKPLKGFTKTIVKRYDEFLKKNELLIDEPILKEVEKSVSQVFKTPILSTPKKIAFIHEDVGHLTGGRYYAYFIIAALMELGHEVTVYSNKKAVFSEEFSDYKKPGFKVIAQTTGELDNIDVQADVYMGSPIHGAYAAVRLGMKYKKPSFALIFDPFPMMERYLGKRAYPGWSPLLSKIKKSNTFIISLCNETKKEIHDWLGVPENKIFPVYPCINSQVLDSKKRTFKRQKYALFISRLVNHKRFEDCVIACKKVGIKLKVISSVNAINAQNIVKRHDMEKQVEFYLRVDDTTKFDMIAKSSVVINGSIFEGFGMFVSEAISTGTPFVGYDYPTFREQVEYSGAKNIYLAKPQSRKDLAQKLQQALDEKKYEKPSRAFHFEEMVDTLKEI